MCNFFLFILKPFGIDALYKEVTSVFKQQRDVTCSYLYRVKSDDFISLPQSSVSKLFAIF